MRRLIGAARTPAGCGALTVACATTILLLSACGGAAPARRVIVLGFDGLDYRLTRTLLDQGRLPNFARLAATGGFAPLSTSIPPQSPVAWSSFITGRGPGAHGIFDFVHRDPATMTPYLSTTATEGPRRAIRIGGWQIPLTGGTVELLRDGQPFWEVLERRGVQTTIVRMPANFPPSGTATRELSGMGTPDLLGTYGTFSFYTSEPFAALGRSVAGGTFHEITVRDGVVRARLIGPNNPLRREPEPLSAEFTVHVDPARGVARFVAGREARVLAVGEWSDWVPIEFDLGLPLQRLRGICRFYLKRLTPDVEVYVTPINLDPLSAALPIAHPENYAAELAAATGRFYTQGMPEDTHALRAGVFTRDEFLAQARLAHDENVRQYRHVRDRFDRGLLFYYFGGVDQVSHMMWRAMDPDHPAYDPVADPPYATVVKDLYVGLDAIVGETLDRLGAADTLIVLSDHGFTSWRRAFHLNSWLKENGYLVLIDPDRRDDPGYFGNVDWARTRAYAVGLNGLYVNLRGRERSGAVAPEERDALLQDIRATLLATTDPATGKPAVREAYRTDQLYGSGHSDRAPDLIVSYVEGVRGSDESALGGIPAEVIVDNLSAWSGDHCMDHDAVPGVLLSNRPLRRPAPSLDRVAAAVLAEFGVEAFPTPPGAR
jgi:predicted AlkP superfamily phosphohydrolase/phosphomutase